MREIRDAHGPDALGVITSSRSTNEAAYLLQKLFRTAIGTNNVDCCARVCHSSTAPALQHVTGTGAATASYADIERARSIVLAGANPTEAHPVVGARIKQAVLRGAGLIVIDPRRIELAAFADLHLALRPGTNVALFNAIAKILIDEGSSIESTSAVGWKVSKTSRRLLDFDLARGGRADHRRCELGHSRAPPNAIGRAGPTLFVHGLGLSELTQGTASVMTLANLAMLTGSIGRAGAGMLPLRGQNNVQGNADMGSMPTQLTGYQPLDDPAVRARLREIWGQEPPLEPGLTIPEMLAAARERRRSARCGSRAKTSRRAIPTRPASSKPSKRSICSSSRSCSSRPTAERAHLVLPAAGVLEQEGTFTNAERRIQHVRPAVHHRGRRSPTGGSCSRSRRRSGCRGRTAVQQTSWTRSPA